MLRELRLDDAESMLEWMHDNEVIGLLPTRFNDMTLDDCYIFIKKALIDKERNIHFAVTNEYSDYLGTISLKNINYRDRNAEYAIVLGKRAIGKRVAHKATMDLLQYAFEILKLERVYLCVFEDNIRAVKFYNKFGFKYEGKFRKHMQGAKDNTLHDLLWYGILKDEYYQLKNKEAES